MPTLQSVIKKKYSGNKELISAVILWMGRQSPQGRVPFDEQPEISKAIWTLDALARSLAVSGTTHFLLDMGSEAQRIGEYARMLEAPTTQRYAEAMIRELKRLNRGKLPDATRGAMTSAIKRLESRDEAAGGTGLFLDLDDKFSADVIEELETTVAGYVRNHAADIVEAFDTLVRPAPPVIEPTATDSKGRRYFSADFRDYDSRAREWLRRAESLSVADYAEVAKRFRKGIGSTVRRKTMQVWTDGPRVGRTEAEWKPEFMATLRLSADVERTLTAKLAVPDIAPAARGKALEAYRTAASAIKHLPELERLSWGPEVIAAAIAPFDGFLPAWNAKW